MAYGDARVTTICIRRTFYVPPPLVLLLLSRELIMVKTWQRLRGVLVTANLEADFRLSLTGCMSRWFDLLQMHSTSL